MSYLELYASQTNVFGGFQKSFQEAKYVVFGVPFDATSTYLTGARFAPNAIRQASQNIETYSFRSGIDIEELAVYDAGDLPSSSNAKTTFEAIQHVIEDILAQGKMPVALGGEHTITLAIAQGLGVKASKTAVVSIDAHLDLRTEYLDSTLSHTTFMQLINKQVKPAKIFEVGTRAAGKEELDYAKSAGVEFFTSQQIIKNGSEQIAEQLKEKLRSFDYVYLSLDLDVLDPAFLPGVQNPEPEGLNITQLFDVILSLCTKRVIGLDVVELVPTYDQGVSAIVAAKILFEMLCQLEKSKRNSQIA
jgi:agmatinase